MRTIDANIKGVLYGIAAAVRHLQQQKAGHIINVSSVAGLMASPMCAGSLRRYDSSRGWKQRVTIWVHFHFVYGKPPLASRRCYPSAIANCHKIHYRIHQDISKGFQNHPDR
ncbi:MAG: SDR family NAD(P)-dependent oxidoreductase [Nostoc sp.]